MPTRHSFHDDDPAADLESLIDLTDPPPDPTKQQNGSAVRHKFDPQRHRLAVFRLPDGQTVKLELPAEVDDDDRIVLLRAVNACLRQCHSADARREGE